MNLPGPMVGVMSITTPRMKCLPPPILSGFLGMWSVPHDKKTDKIKGHLEKLLFFPISALCLKIYPRNINYMPAVNFVACLDLDQINADFEISNFSR